jgi:acetoin utilization deacetylase AcuC-like enzyme
MTFLYRDTLFLRHLTGAHPECAARLRSINEQLDKSGLVDRCAPGTYAALTEDEVRRVHSSGVVEIVHEAVSHGGGYIEADTVVSPESLSVALAAAGACASAVSAVLTGSERNALCLVRPPGHHATPTRSMGFCLFNNIALAARRALDVHGANRVLIVDWDVHHGNGTQDIFYDDGAVTFLSIHRYGDGFYPGTGAKDETGSGRGLGHTVNVPIHFGTSRREYRAALVAKLEDAARVAKPDIVLLSAGFDAHALDPVGSLGLEVEDFAWMTSAVLDIARTHAGGRCVSCLEGGYNLRVLTEALPVHLGELLRAES